MGSVDPPPPKRHGLPGPVPSIRAAEFGVSLPRVSGLLTHLPALRTVHRLLFASVPFLLLCVLPRVCSRPLHGLPLTAMHWCFEFSGLPTGSAAFWPGFWAVSSPSSPLCLLFPRRRQRRTQAAAHAWVDSVPPGKTQLVVRSLSQCFTNAVTLPSRLSSALGLDSLLLASSLVCLGAGLGKVSALQPPFNPFPCLSPTSCPPAN